MKEEFLEKVAGFGHILYELELEKSLEISKITCFGKSKRNRVLRWKNYIQVLICFIE